MGKELPQKIPGRDIQSRGVKGHGGRRRQRESKSSWSMHYDVVMSGLLPNLDNNITLKLYLLLKLHQFIRTMKRVTIILLNDLKK